MQWKKLFVKESQKIIINKIWAVLFALIYVIYIIVTHNIHENLSIENVHVRATKFGHVDYNNIGGVIGLPPLDRMNNYGYKIPTEYVVELYPQKGIVFFEGQGKIKEAYIAYKTNTINIVKMEQENKTFKVAGELSGVSPDYFKVSIEPVISNFLITKHEDDTLFNPISAEYCLVFVDEFDYTMSVYYFSVDLISSLSSNDTNNSLAYSAAYRDPYAYSYDFILNQMNEADEPEQRENLEIIRNFMIESRNAVLEYKE